MGVTGIEAAAAEVSAVQHTHREERAQCRRLRVIKTQVQERRMAGHFHRNLMPFSSREPSRLHLLADAAGVLNLAMLEELKLGSMVRVAEGPFEGFMGTISWTKSEQRVIVLLQVLGAVRSVEMQLNQIDKA